MKVSLVAASCLVLGLLLASPRRAVSQSSNGASKLQVRANYTGAGTVDEKHKIYIVLWDSPDFVRGGSMPVEIKSLASKDGAVTFEGVNKSPAYVSSVYDASGEWDAQSAPPEGCSLGLYYKTPGTPEPIELKAGTTTTVKLTFDDSVKMRSGAPSR